VTKPRPRHPNKEIEKALAYAETQGWRVVLLNGHAWGKIQCPWNDADCRCVLSGLGLEYAARAGEHGPQYPPARGWMCAADGGGSREGWLSIRPETM